MHQPPHGKKQITYMERYIDQRWKERKRRTERRQAALWPELAIGCVTPGEQQSEARQRCKVGNRHRPCT